MSKAIELARECHVLAGYEGEPEFLETFFRRAQAMALRDAAKRYDKECGREAFGGTIAFELELLAAELEAGK